VDVEANRVGLGVVMPVANSEANLVDYLVDCLEVHLVDSLKVHLVAN
jgi:hypothetical protein